MHSDANTKGIVKTLRDAGASVFYLDPAGRKDAKGIPDLLVGFLGATFLLEVKKPGEDLNDNQIAWHAAWRGGYHRVVHGEAEALIAIGLVP